MVHLLAGPSRYLAAPAGPHHRGGGYGRQLPVTGGPTGLLAVVGVVLVALGGLLAAAAARRRQVSS